MNKSNLTQVVFNTLTQLEIIVDQLNNDELQKKLPLIFNSSIGMHIRHVIEFYICLLNPLEEDVVCYDNRDRNLKLEEDSDFILKTISKLKIDLDDFKERNINLSVNYFLEGISDSIPSTTLRELIYNIEHAVHHLAIIKIAINHHFNHVELPEFFGIAQSTIAHHLNK